MTNLAKKFINAYAEMKKSTGYLMTANYILKSQIESNYCDVSEIAGTNGMGFEFKDGSIMLTKNNGENIVFLNKRELVSASELAVYE